MSSPMKNAVTMPMTTKAHAAVVSREELLWIKVLRVETWLEEASEFVEFERGTRLVEASTAPTSETASEADPNSKIFLRNLLATTPQNPTSTSAQSNIEPSSPDHSEVKLNKGEVLLLPYSATNLTVKSLVMSARSRITKEKTRPATAR